jgi:hypothetical protein
VGYLLIRGSFDSDVHRESLAAPCARGR